MTPEIVDVSSISREALDDDKTQDQRLAACISLAPHANHPLGVDALLMLANAAVEPSAEVRWRAIEALGASRIPHVAEVMEGPLSRNEPDPALRLALHEAALSIIQNAIALQKVSTRRQHKQGRLA